MAEITDWVCQLAAERHSVRNRASETGKNKHLGIEDELQDARAALNAELRAAFKEDPSSLSADDRARAEQLLARDARKAATKAARRVSSETPSPGTA